MGERYLKNAPTLVDLGYDVTPVEGKRPVIKGWSTRPDTAKQYASFPDHNIGIVLGGPCNLIAIDVDVCNELAAKAIQKLIEDEFGTAPRRIGKAPKFLMPFRCTEPIKKIAGKIFKIDGQKAQVEILAEGQQFVASGIHPDTGEKYVWPDDSVLDYRITELPIITPKALMAFLAASEAVLAPYCEQPQPPRQLVLSENAVRLQCMKNDDNWHDNMRDLVASRVSEGWTDQQILEEAMTGQLPGYTTEQTTAEVQTAIDGARAKGFDKNEADVAYEAARAATGVEQYETPERDPSRSDITLAAWLEKDIPPRDYLLGSVLSSTSRWLLYGYTGLGKTLFCLNIAAAVAAGQPFLAWEQRTTQRRVMYIDGELPNETFKERMEQIAEVYGSELQLYGYNRDDLEDGSIPPLNTPQGEAWLMNEIATIKPELIVFDSIMALLTGSMKEEEPWEPVKVMIRRITSMRIAQIWMDHSGYNATKAYGTSTKMWEMDTVIRLEKTNNGIGFNLAFDKARLRNGGNFDQFQPLNVEMQLGRFVYSVIENNTGQSATRFSLTREIPKVMYDLIARGKCVATTGHDMKPVTAVKLDDIRDHLKDRGLLEVEENSVTSTARQSFRRSRENLIASGVIYGDSRLVWFGANSEGV